MLLTKGFALLALPLLVVANPLIARSDPPKSCNSGTLKCCKSLNDAKSPVVKDFLDLLHISAVINGLVALTCSPITVVGVGSGTRCQQQTLCCTGESYENGAVNLGCSPIGLNI